METNNPISIKMVRGVAHVQFLNKFYRDDKDIATLQSQLRAILPRKDCGKIVLDFDGAEYVSSQFMGILIAFKKDATRNGTFVCTCAMDDDVVQQFAVPLDEGECLFSFEDTFDKAYEFLTR